jgi:hypothetical protein
MTTRRKGGQRRGFANAEKALQTARNARHEAKLNEFRGVLESVQGTRPGPITPNNTGPKMNTGLGFLQFLGPENLARLSRVNRGFRNMVKQTFHFQRFTLKPGQTLVQLYKSFPGALNIDLSKRPDIQDRELLEAIPLGFKNVRILDMGYCREITDAGLAPLTNLTSLNMVDCNQITDAALARLTNLTSLNMRDCERITDIGLAPLTNLTSLNIAFCRRITDAGLARLTNLTSLVMAQCTGITNAGLAPLTNLTSLNMMFCEQITDVGLASLTNLTSLVMTQCTGITDAGLAPFTNLTRLDMDYCRQITDAGLARLTNLTSLNIEFCPQITPAAFTNLNKLEYCTAFGLSQDVKEAAKAKIAENRARNSVSTMEALDGGTRRRRSKKHKQSKKTRRL